ncbi:sulfhydryl oxidase 2-like isoform X2 [Nymphaea colorata]|nr:sulfhydryl oxidase 2-like isoform X2 [Nymphaea colorata]
MSMMVGTMKMVLCVSFLVLPTVVQPAIMDDIWAAGGSAAGQRRWLLRSLNDPGSSDFAVELNGSNFDEVLKNAPSPWAIVEFFAHWCPACRNYKPQYEKVAVLFNGADAVHGGIILMTRVDCALKTNTKLCDRFSVGHFPMLLWGPPAEFASGNWEPKNNKSKIQAIDDARTADRLLNWINKQIGRSFSFDDEKMEEQHLHSQNISVSGPILQAIFDVEEATAKAFEIIFEHKMVKPNTRAPLIQFLQLLVAHHPSMRCRKGSSEMLINFDNASPLNFWSPHTEKDAIPIENSVLKSSHVCGEEVPRGYWIFCRGSKNETRGFSCGLWVLLHSLSVRVDDAESHLAFSTICSFIHDFFICEECRQHFYKMCSSVASPFNKTQDFALWLWRTHNKVNQRLMKEEEALKTGDPKFPKKVWPSRLLCSSCYLSADGEENDATKVKWNETEVFHFLIGYYGKTIKSASDILSRKESHTDMVDDLTGSNAVAVPVGAALAIAFASCAFGVLAWYWRLQQKSRKYLHQRYSSKNI